MFDQKPTQSNISSGNQPVSTGASSSDSAVSSAGNNAPEDIFASVKNPAPQSQPSGVSSADSAEHSPANNSNGKKTSSSNMEPSLKQAPSVFNKIPSVKSSASAQAFNQMQSSQGTAPYVGAGGAGRGSSKKIIIVIVFVALLALASGTFWYFNNRSSGGSSEIVPADSKQSTKLFDNTTAKKGGTSANKKNAAQLGNQNQSSDQPKDTDGDGLSDEEEAALGTSLTSPDTDNDGLFDKEEVKVYKTDPLKADTDGDGYNDGEEVKDKTNPLEADSHPAENKQNLYQNKLYKFSFTLPEGLSFETQQSGIVQFNDNINQIKVYIYINGTQPANLAPDVLYQIGEDDHGKLLIIKQEKMPDRTPFSTDLATQAYRAHNGLTYLIRYVATKRAPDHVEKFTNLLKSFEFIK